jgi:hypothetical protein
VFEDIDEWICHISVGSVAMELNSQPKPTRATTSRVARQHPRYLFSVPVTLRRLVRGGFQTTRGMSLDISEGGVSAIVQANLSVGETVEINLPLSACPLHTVAIVRHVTDSRSGFEFLGLTQEERHQISVAGRAL